MKRLQEERNFADNLTEKRRIHELSRFDSCSKLSSRKNEGDKFKNLCKYAEGKIRNKMDSLSKRTESTMAAKDRETLEVFHKFYDKQMKSMPKQLKIWVDRSDADIET